MNSTAVILLVLLAIYVPLWAWVLKSDRAKSLGLEIWGPAIKINTRLGLRIMDRLAVYHRFWRFFGVASQIISAVLMFFMILLMAISVINLPNALRSSGIGIEYAIAIPGLNPLMPFWFTLLAFIVALVCHEMAHGLQARSNGMGVKHTGLLYGVVPLGAFVEPDEGDVEKSSRRARLDLYAAGISTNFVIGAVSFLLFSVVLLGGVTTPYSDHAGVFSNTDSDGIPVGAIITEVDGVSFTMSDISEPVSTEILWSLGHPVDVTYTTSSASGLTKTLAWGASIAGLTESSPAVAAGLAKGDTVYCIEDSAGQHYFYSNLAFSVYMRSTSSGQEVTVHYVEKSSGTAQSKVVTLSSGPGGNGFLGIVTTASGMSLVTPEQVKALASDPLYNRSGVADCVMGMLGYISHPFQGFTPVPEDLHWWYSESFSGFWALVNTLFWMFWLNILLGVTNALPAVPFDGGYIFRGWLDKALEVLGRRDVEERSRQCDEITHNISVLMLVLLLIVVFAALS